jgi:hypothetical protein
MIKKLSFEESLELSPLSEDDLQELDDLRESNDYYGSALTPQQRNPNLI